MDIEEKMTIMKLRKLPDKKEVRTITHKFMSVDGVRMPISVGLIDLLFDLQDTNSFHCYLRIDSKELIEALVKCGFVKNGNRGRGGDAIIAGGLYYCTDKFKRCYKQLTAKIESLVYDKAGNII
jgi:hypothetical protein